MTDAYLCDHCNDFEEGEATLTITMKIGGEGGGLLSAFFGSGGPSASFDFCSLSCADAFDFSTVKDELVAEIDDKQELLDAECEELDSPEPPMEGRR